MPITILSIVKYSSVDNEEFVNAIDMFAIFVEVGVLNPKNLSFSESILYDLTTPEAYPTFTVIGICE